MHYPAPLDPERLVRTLAAYRVAYVLVGALAARLQGMPRMTADADITPEASPQNLTRLASALTELGARVHTDSIPEGLVFDCSAATLARGRIWNLTTEAGRLDLVFEPDGTSGYEDLEPDAVRIEVFDLTILVASIPQMIRMKRASDRPQDRQDVIVLEDILARQRGE